MFKSAKWRKEKIKAVFGMQFQATQVPQLKAKSLMISLISADTRRTSVKMGRAKIVEGACSWESPVCETIKLERDPKTGRIQEKIYYFVVATKSSKSGFLGEVGVDFAKLAEITEPLVLSLPLMPSDSGVILHVTVQKMQGTLDQRSKEDNEVMMTYDQCSHCSETEVDGYGDTTTTSTEALECNKTSQDFEQNCILTGHPLDDTSVQHDLNGHEHNPKLQKSLERHHRWLSSTDISLGYTSDGSIIDASSVAKEDLSGDIVQEPESHNLERIQNQIIKEIRRGKELSEQIVDLQERDADMRECENIKLQTKDQRFSNASETEMEISRAKFEELRHERQQEKHLRDRLKSRLQETEDSNSELIITIKHLNQKLEQKNKESEEMKQKIEKLLQEREVLCKENEDLKMQKDQLLSDYAILKKENEESETEKVELQQEFLEALAKIKQFEVQAKELEDEIQKQSVQFLESMQTINKQKTEIMSLEKEARAFEDALEAIALSKVEQEKRAVQAEEEISRIAAEMVSKIYEKEKLANNARAEANALLWNNKVLEESLEKANEQLKLTKDHYERELYHLSTQNNLKLLEESTKTQTLEDENTRIKETLLSEIEKLQAQHNEAAHGSDSLKLENDNLKKQLHKLTNGQAVNIYDLDEVLTEVASLREKNKHMEDELKEMEERYSEISLRFAEVESERQQLVMVLRNLKNGKKN
ncbi:PREDICTED: thyroid receptor-interacting protein 11-like isoform X2 [Ipomoea nil]|uniref:thyroid receptor-interacting protein 11-like isoform X2 n=1 Tax=Ipomoea nil TaxID=35883 RepID=UPI000900BD66|nr:PREDICTED: thyroid receptor-interacting protein 11-like isoform X2 [Ipomoea nil]